MKIDKNKNCYSVKATQPRYSLPDGKRSIYVGSPDDPRYKHWAGLIERRNLLREYERLLKAHERLEAKKKKPEAPSVEWYTPPEHIEMARQVMGGIDLDPASNPIAQQWVNAGQFYTKDDDGLTQPWFGRVWCNPPYGKFSRLFLDRGLKLYQDGAVTDCIFLVNRTGAAWYLDLAEHFVARCQVRKRISFLNPEGKPEGSPRYYNDFLYLGPSPDRFKEIFEPIGRVWH